MERTGLAPPGPVPVPVLLHRAQGPAVGSTELLRSCSEGARLTPTPHGQELPFTLSQSPLAAGALLCSRVFEMLHVAMGPKKLKRRICSRLAALEVVSMCL